jgi:hypothetical protein
MEFIDGKVYRCKVLPGAQFKKSTAKQTPYFLVWLEVTGGDMEGAKLPREIYFTKGTLDNGGPQQELKLLGVSDITKVNVREWPEIIFGKECGAECRIQRDEKGRNDRVTANRIVDIASLIPGGVEAEIAALVGNTATPPADKDGFSDQY